jgi:hypothetical protein
MLRHSTRNPAARVVAAVFAAVLTTALLTGSVQSASAATTTTLTPVADTRVQNDEPTTNFGTSDELGVDASEAVRSFLKFTVSGLTEPISTATLRLHVTDRPGAASNDGGIWTLMSETGWSETAMTWEDQPAISGPTVADIGHVSPGSWIEIDLTGAITGNGTYSIGGLSTSNNGADFDSRESGFAPQLLITTGSTVTPPPPPPPPPASGDPVLVGAGDIATSGSGDTATAALIEALPNATVVALGDNAYEDGTLSNYRTYYDPTWGAFKARTRPTPGNHDYHTSGAAGYFDYYGALAGPSGRGYYSYDLGSWHVVSLDSEISMAKGSAQETWLRADLAGSAQPCTVAYWHKPLFTSGAKHAPYTAARPLFQALYDAGAELVLSGHNHQYERFAPMTPTGAHDEAEGIREIVVGTGGAEHYGFSTIEPNSQAHNGDTFGVLKLTLHSNSYDWRFIPVAGKTYTDSGSGTCH